MATDKRERQRANRAQKKATEAKKRRFRDGWLLTRKWALWGAAIILVVLVLSLLR